MEIDLRYFGPAGLDHLQDDASKTRKKLGWHPRVDFEQLVAMMVDSDLS